MGVRQMIRFRLFFGPMRNDIYAVASVSIFRSFFALRKVVIMEVSHV